ncbi:Methyl-accepting chemotaxis protein III [Pelagimonas phthalicica]|uniref:Methyl-accepting chemotaxis protein III n=1 Tax=Pelagimonas phthalicica TaxID=1037362 RepID=A0A238JCQ8_9RHOB|nr:methyl-accepting chemotaxis protein [Pelagimonas phthalicica]TDS93850.1 methyl-accepting chemotaxis protein [Pelagimonas phthalicica]SMX27626.1 Methyl-accepting chemotaxis protein III [Pelagimonas phthalicica]
MQAIFSLPVRTLGRAIVGSILFTAIMIAGMSFWSFNRTGDAANLMSEYERRANPSERAQNELVQALGYGGMIHQFKNYVLRGDEKYYHAAGQNAGAAMAALEQLKNLNPEKAEELDAVGQTIQSYVAALETVENQYGAGKSAAETDSVVKIDDSPALNAITSLSASRAETETESKASILAELRGHIGYGGMIHQFKNLVLRGDKPRIAKVEAAAAAAQAALARYRAMSHSPEEGQAIADIEQTIGKYAAALTDVSAMIDAGKSAEEMDSVVKISDGPALDGLRVLDAAVVAEGRQISQTVHDNLAATQTLVTIVGGIIAVLSLLTALGAREILRRGVVSKQDKADEMAATLQQEREDFQMQVSQLAAAASAGDFSKRINRDYGDDTLAEVASHLDQLLDKIEGGLNAVVQVSHALARGDLTQRMDGDFDGAFARLQLSMNEAVTSMSDSIRAVLGSSSEISDYTANISSAASDLARRTETQSYNLETSAATLGELTSSVDEISTRVSAARGTAEAANEIAQNGATVVEEAISAMDKIVDTSKKISKVTELIEEIAFQTNLLALNAGVEAARAGESGRGFAVVASEVLALAHRASDAVQEINDLISSSELEIEDGAGRIAEAGNSIKGISGYVRELDQAIEAVASSTGDQATRLNQVNKAISELEGVTQQNASMFEQTAASIQSLNELTSDLLGTGEKFQVEPPQTAPEQEHELKEAS